VTTAPPPTKKKKSDPTLGLLLIFIAGLALACALLWAGWTSLKRSADPYASPASKSSGHTARSALHQFNA
jgi:hypothetical protein